MSQATWNAWKAVAVVVMAALLAAAICSPLFGDEIVMSVLNVVVWACVSIVVLHMAMDLWFSLARLWAKLPANDDDAECVIDIENGVPVDAKREWWDVRLWDGACGHCIMTTSDPLKAWALWQLDPNHTTINWVLMYPTYSSTQRIA